MNIAARSRPGVYGVVLGVILVFTAPAFAEPTTFRYESTTRGSDGTTVNVTVAFVFDSALENGTGAFGVSPNNGSYGPWTGTLTVGDHTVALHGGTIEVFNNAGGQSEDGYDFRWEAPRGSSQGSLEGGQLCSFRVLLVDRSGAMLSSTALPSDVAFADKAEFIQDNYSVSAGSCIDYYGQVNFGLSESGASPNNRPFILRVVDPTPAATLWYNGDGDPEWFNGGIHNNIDWSLFDKSEMVYEDLVVDHPDGWTVTELWSNNVTNSRLSINTARWSIRQGMVAGGTATGGGGQVIAEGLAPATQTLHQVVDDGWLRTEEHTIKVSGLDVRLSPGTYWVAVAPVIINNDQSLPSDTLGFAVNAVGISGGSDNAHVHQQDWMYAGQDEFLLSSRFGSRDGPPNYSLGVGGQLGGAPPADLSAPLIAAVVSGTVGTADWYVGHVQVDWTVTDGESAVSESTGCDTSSVTTDTAGTVFTCSATSAGGTATETVTIKRDSTAPTATASAGPSANTYGWRKQNVTVAFRGEDAMSGGVTCDPNVVLTTEGSDQSASGRCYDAAGNQSALATASGINIDKTGPTVSIASPVGGTTYKVGDTVTASYSCGDALSGVATCTGTVPEGQSITTSKKTKNAKFTVTATDQAGNTTRQTVAYSVN